MRGFTYYHMVIPSEIRARKKDGDDPSGSPTSATPHAVANAKEAANKAGKTLKSPNHERTRRIPTGIHTYSQC